MNACRACAALLPAPFLSLGAQPLSNAYLRADQLGAMEPTYPLDVSWCAACGLVQIGELARADHIFASDYAYFSSYSESWLAHCRVYTAEMIARYGITPTSSVVEVASNDGYLLQYFRERGIPVLGVEPAASVANAAIAKGIPTDLAFFTRAYAEAIPRRADLLVANNVLAHTPAIADFAAGIAAALAPAGVATLEFPHLLRLVERDQFDTIYHEHYSYLSLQAVAALFRRHGLAVFHVEELATHGGSLRLHVQRADTGTRALDPSVEAVLAAERTGGLDRPDTYAAFAARVARTKRRLLAVLLELADAGKRIAAYGAPAKGNTLLNYCGIRTDFIAYTVDRSPHKQGKFLPGSRIPILAPDHLFSDRPDCVMILPWNLQEELLEQLAPARAWGARFLIPIPDPRLVP